jgi:2-methylisocitrate lyase-like PEP mutase family enzyme
MGQSFRDLHVPGNPFILANAWDKGTARLFAGLGAQALATSSGALSFSLGRTDMGNVTRDEALAHAQEIVSATSLPVSGDFENGFGDSPDCVAETVALAAEIGLAGISIEDMQLPQVRAYDFALAVERIKAASAKARSLPDDFVLVARADGPMNEQYDLDEAIKRIQAFEAAGADCVYVPYLSDLESVARVCSSVSIPVNVSISNVQSEPLSALAMAGVARISMGQALATAAHSTLYKICEDMFARGDFSRLKASLSYVDIDAAMLKGQ